jgi:DNA polymerase-3 subunit epsilon
MRGIHKPGCCFPTGEHYPGLANRIAEGVQRVEGLCDDFEAGANWADIPMVIVDFETTGRDAKVDKIIEVGLVHFDQGQVTQRHSFLIQPGMPVPPDSTAVHGITDEDLAGKPSFAELFPSFLPLLANRVPVAYNASFDRGFLVEEFSRASSSLSLTDELPPALRPGVRWVDPLVWARELLTELKSRRLGSVCEHLEIDIGQAHRAADDAAATGKVLSALAPKMPSTYGELVRIQDRYSARQEAEFASWRKRRG